MTLIGLIVQLGVVGALLYLIDEYIPMDNSVKRVINYVALGAVILYLLHTFGILGNLGVGGAGIPVPTLNGK